jgi:hypothetical protein
MGSALCMGCGKQPVQVLPQARTTIPQNSITKMIMVEQRINQFIKTQTKAIVNTPTMMTRCGCTKAKKKEEMAKKRLMSQ